MKTFLGTVSFFASVTVCAADDIYVCSSWDTMEEIRITRFDGENHGRIERENFEGEVLAYPGLGSIMFVALGDNPATTVTYNIDMTEHTFSAMHGAREEEGVCTVIASGGTWEYVVPDGSVSSRSHF